MSVGSGVGNGGRVSSVGRGGGSSGTSGSVGSLGRLVALGSVELVRGGAYNDMVLYKFH